MFSFSPLDETLPKKKRYIYTPINQAPISTITTFVFKQW